MNKQWCKHISCAKRGYPDKAIPAHWEYWYNGSPVFKKWKLCPECETPRPKEEPKELWEVLLGDNPFKDGEFSKAISKYQADKAKSWFLSRISEKELGNIICHHKPRYPYEIVDRIMQYLKEVLK